jgi:tRNA(Ile)-lysidine synthase
LLLEIAQQDLMAAGAPPAIAALQVLSQPRQANLLRHWLQQHRATPSAAQMAQLLRQVAACTTRGHQIHLKVAAGHVIRQGAVLHYLPAAGKAAPGVGPAGLASL